MPHKCTLPNEIRSLRKQLRMAPSIEREIDAELAEIGMNLADFLERFVAEGKLKEYKDEILEQQEARFNRLLAENGVKI